ncbi:MAG TPA: GNAT family N-acetyltransferase [Kiritimatiellia bacterium]|nr:GNAT family N-acetyltransferase [Kiritimatiellia bacterium]
MLRKGLIYENPGAACSVAEAVVFRTLEHIATLLPETVRLAGRGADELAGEVRRAAVDIVVFDPRLPEPVALVLKGLGVVLVLIGQSEVLEPLADICIDPTRPSHPARLSGPRYLLPGLLKNIRVEDIAALMKMPAELLKEEIETNSAEVDIPEILSLFSIMPWDSDFFGYPVGFLACRRLTPSIQHLVKSFTSAHRVVLLEYLCNCHDWVSVQTAEQAGYSFVDIRLTLEHALRKAPNSILPEGTSIIRAEAAHIPALKQMASELYLDSRYFFDPHFDRSKVREFYESWIEKAVLGKFDDYCFLLVRDGKTPLAFCTIRKGRPKTAHIGLFGVSPEAQGGGIAASLLNAVLARLHADGLEMVEVVTQGRNYRAQRVYQRCGFVTKTTELWYHKWFI